MSEPEDDKDRQLRVLSSRPTRASFATLFSPSVSQLANELGRTLAAQNNDLRLELEQLREEQSSARDAEKIRLLQEQDEAKVDTFMMGARS